MKARARELGLTDAAVSRALGVGQRRYSAYANEMREPDFGTLACICHVLRTTPDAVLGFAQHPDAGDAALVRIAVAVGCMDGQDRAQSRRSWRLWPRTRAAKQEMPRTRGPDAHRPQVNHGHWERLGPLLPARGAVQLRRTTDAAVARWPTGPRSSWDGAMACHPRRCASPGATRRIMVCWTPNCLVADATLLRPPAAPAGPRPDGPAAGWQPQRQRRCHPRSG